MSQAHRVLLEQSAAEGVDRVGPTTWQDAPAEHEQDSAVERDRLLRPRNAWWLWLALAALWFATSPVRPLLDPDEGRYAEIPREIVASGDWVTPHLDDLKYFEKPPLQYWATAATYKLFGQSPWTARLWTVGVSFLCLPLVFAWTARRYGRAAGLAALLALAVSPYFEFVGHLNLLDGAFSFWLDATLFSFALAQCAPLASKSERNWMLVAWLAAALAVLSKGIVVGVLSGATLTLYCVLERDTRPWRRLHWLAGVPLCLLVAAPWFVTVSLRNPGFAGFFFVHEHFARFLTTVHERVEPWWYFTVVLVIAALPWLAALPAATREAWSSEPADSQFKPLKFFLLFAVVTLVFFSASGSKLAPYILPAIPPLVVIVGVMAARRSNFARQTGTLTGILLLILGAGLAIYCGHVYGVLPAPFIGWLLGVGVAALLILLATDKLHRSPSRLACTVAAAAILGWQSLLCAFAAIPDRSGHDLLETARPAIRPDTELFSLDQYRETLSPYLHRTLTLVHFQGELAYGLSEDPSKELSDEAFLAHWNASNNAVAFVSPRALPSWLRRGLQGREIARDNETVVISRM